MTGGRGMTRRAPARPQTGGAERGRLNRGRRATHESLRALDGSYDAAIAAMRNCRAAGMQVAVNTQVNRASMHDLEDVLDVLLREGAHGWQAQLTVPVGRAADEPYVILQPYDLLGVFPVLAALKERCDRAGVIVLAGNNVGYFGPYEHVLQSYCASGTGSRAWPASRRSASNQRRHQGLPLAADGCLGRRQRPPALAPRHLGALPPLRHMRDRTRAELWGYCAGCYYADECRAGCTWMASALFGRPGNNPYCHHRALRIHKLGKRERVTLQKRRRTLLDHGRWELVVESSE